MAAQRVPQRSRHRWHAPEKGSGPAFALSLLAHTLLFIAIAFVVRWKSEPVGTVSAELWSLPPAAMQQPALPTPAPAAGAGEGRTAAAGATPQGRNRRGKKGASENRTEERVATEKGRAEEGRSSKEGAAKKRKPRLMRKRRRRVRRSRRPRSNACWLRPARLLRPVAPAVAALTNTQRR